MMFRHIFKYRLKCLLRDWENLFWTALFPILLASFFFMSLSNLTKNEQFNPINIAVVDNGQYRNNKSFMLALDSASKGDERLFNLSVTSQEQAEQMLKDDEIYGYIIAEEPIKLIVKNLGINQSIIKSFLDIYIQTESAAESILAENLSAMQSLLADINSRKSFVNDVPISKVAPDATTIFYYTVIAMACFYGGYLGLREVSDIQANISSVAARVNMAPVHKMKAFLSSAAAALLLHFCEVLILLAYLIFILKVDFGTRIIYVLLTAFVGSVMGLSFGTLISALVKKGEGVKIAIFTCFTMLCSFLSGMMNQGVKYKVDTELPLLSWMNPVNKLTDSFYCLHYYDTLSKYALNMAAITGFALIYCLATYLIIRRRKYASI